MILQECVATLKGHKLFLEGQEVGVRIGLTTADLSGANLGLSKTIRMIGVKTFLS